ncbi:MAG: glycosyltransferase family 87 protein [Gemmataceae bacterium]
MTFAAAAAWLRSKLWIGWPVGATAWMVWLGSVSYGCWKEQRPVDAEGTPVCVDHLTFYSAAKLVREGRAAEMYHYDFLGRYQGEQLGWDWGMLLGYRNPPFYALLYLPTTGLSFVESMLVWNAIGLGVLVLAIGWLKPENPRRVLMWSLTFYPVFAVLSFGQNSLLSMGVFAAVYRLMSSNRFLLAGLVAGLLWFKPQLLLGLFLWWGFAPRKYVACWLGVAVTGAILAAISWLVLPDASWAFVESLEANLAYGGEKGWNKESPRAFWSLLLPDSTSAVIGILTLATVLPMILAAWRVAKRSGAEVAVMFPVAVFLSLWVSPHTLIYEWAILIPAAAVLWERFPEKRDAWLVLFAAAWIVLAASTPLAKIQIDFLKPPGVLQIAVPAMGVIGWLVMRSLTPLPRLCRGEVGVV